MEYKKNNENGHDGKNMEESDDNKNQVIKSADDFEFLQERIKERPVDKRKLLQRTLITAGLALLFGGIACLSFLLLEPVLNNWIYPEEEPEIVTFPQEKDEMLPEDMLTEGDTNPSSGDTGSAQNEKGSIDKNSPADSETQKPISRPPVSDNNGDNGNTGDDAKEGDAYSEGGAAEVDEPSQNPPDNGALQSEEEPVISPLKEYQAKYEELYKIYRQVSTSMVTVTSVRQDVDWFNNTYTSEGTQAGVIVANNNRELLVLTKRKPLEKAEAISVRFCNGVSADAQIKSYDVNTDLAAIAVDLKYVGNSTLEYISVAKLGSSNYSGITGTPIIAIGNIFGYKDNVCYGMVTSKGNAITLADSEYNLITTDIYASANPTGILVNMDGEVIGIIENAYNHSDTGNLLSAIGITELKELIAMLSNGEDIPYIGICAKTISAQVRSDLNIQNGVYVYDIEMDSPAMKNGIQKGDLIVSVGKTAVNSATEYMGAVRECEIDNETEIVILRANLNEYEEMRLVIKPVSRIK